MSRKALIQRVLTGALTPKTCPEFFDDDVVYFAVRHVEQLDLDWLVEQIMRAPSRTGARLVVACLSASIRERVISAGALSSRVHRAHQPAGTTQLNEPLRR